MNRRTFLQNSFVTTVASSLPLRAFAATHGISKVGLQLYTVRDAMKADLDGTIAKVAQIGYKELEFAGYFGRTPQQIRAIIDKNHVTAPSCHVPLDVVENHWPETLEAAHVVGHEYIVCPFLDEKDRTGDNLKRLADAFNKAGAASKKAGIQFAYHNHTFEFQPDPALGGKFLYDQLLALTDPDLVKMEMDLCWITCAGQDPVAYFQKYPGRFPLVHVKDVASIPASGKDMGKIVETMVPVGSGAIDWKRIFAHADQGGVKHYFVENDNQKDAFNNIAASYAYLSKVQF